MMTVEAHPFVARAVAKTLRHLDDVTAGALAVELQSLPMLEAMNQLAPIKDLPTGYRSLTLPSGYLALYRRLTPVEIKHVTGEYTDRDAYLVADLVRLIPAPEPADKPAQTVSLRE
jgi:hypothetical protein